MREQHVCLLEMQSGGFSWEDADPAALLRHTRGKLGFLCSVSAGLGTAPNLHKTRAVFFF